VCATWSVVSVCCNCVCVRCVKVCVCVCARVCFTHIQTQVKKNTHGVKRGWQWGRSRNIRVSDRQKERQDSYLQPLPLSVASLSVYAARPSSSVPQVGMVGLTWGCTRGNEEDGEAREGG
jgi:hypothetical protein